MSAEPPHHPIGDANVYGSDLGVPCDPTGCPLYARTAFNGTFLLNGVGVGNIVVSVTDGWNLTNYTVLYNVTKGTGNLSTGDIGLVPDAIVSGCVEGADYSHEGAPDVSVVGETRDGTVQGTPTAVTSSPSGCFSGVAVPPGPAEIEFTPSSGSEYESNDTFVDLAPGQHYELPAPIYLPVGVLVTIEPWDPNLHAPVNDGYPFLTKSVPYDGVTFRSALTGASFGPGTPVKEGGTPQAYAPPGLDVMTVDASGYLENSSPVEIPEEPPGYAVPFGMVYMAPDGKVTGTFGLTWEGPVSNTPWYQEVVQANSSVLLTICSLDGYLSGFAVPTGAGGISMSSSTCLSTCQPFRNVFTTFAAPLRDSVTIAPAASPGVCNDTWPIPDLLPVEGNTTFATVPPGLGVPLSLGEIDFTPGNYIKGRISPGDAWTISACSTDETGVCMPPSGPVNTSGSKGSCRYPYQGDPQYCPYDPIGCPGSAVPDAGSWFCVAAPPGPDRLEISSPTQGLNVTWVDLVPGQYTSKAASLASVSSNLVQMINLSSGGNVSGEIADGVTGEPIPTQEFPTVSISPVTAGVGGSSTGTGSTFNLTSVPGWVTVSASANNFLGNSTWVHVNDSSIPVSTGVIRLDPVSWLQGQILYANGTPAVYATVATCQIGSLGCQSVLENGLTSTGGRYAQELAAAPPPLGTYVVEASAPGYLSNFTWVNVTTPGAFYTAPPIRLTSFLSVASSRTNRSGSRGSPALPPTPDPFEYLVGSVVDSVTQEGIPQALFTLEAVNGGPPTVLENSITDGGFFNYTAPSGQFWDNISAPEYYPLTIFLNLSGVAPELNVGTIRLVAFSGLVNGQLTVEPSSYVTTRYHIGPGDVLVTVCLQFDPAVCGSGLADSSGFFSVPAPAGANDSVSIEPAASASTGSAPGGFLGAAASVTVVNGTVSPLLKANLTLFGEVTGTVYDQSTDNASTVGLGSFAATVIEPDGMVASAGETLGGGGTFTAFLPPGTISGEVLGDAFIPRKFSSPSDLANITAGDVSWFNASLVHYGWITGTVRATSLPSDAVNLTVPNAAVSALGWDAALQSELGTTGPVDDSGYFNVTSPPIRVNLSASAPDFARPTVTNSTYVPVNESQTFDFPFWDWLPLTPWGFVSGRVADPVLDRPIISASVLVTDENQSNPSDPAAVSAANGRFFTDATPGPADVLSLGQSEDLSNSTVVNVSRGVVDQVGTVNLTGYGVVAGQVQGALGTIPLDGASVSVCPIRTPECSDTTTTNVNGIFWALAPPGAQAVNVTAAGYVRNASATVTISTDSWVWMGNISLEPLAGLGGMVLGVPSGLPLVGADVSVCAPTLPGGAPDSFCLVTVETDPDGQFTVSAPAGAYSIAFRAAGYAPQLLSVAIAPGETVDLGTIFLVLDGVINGTVLGADTEAPLTDASAEACATAQGGACTSTARTDALGTFLLTASPGRYQVVLSAPGYQDGYAFATVQSGRIYSIPPSELVPVGSSELFTVNGTIVGTTNEQPIPGATVISAGGFASSPTGDTGSYSIVVPWGSYSFAARAAGFDVAWQNITVHQDLGNVDFALAPSLYVVSGRVTDGLSGTGLSDAMITIPYVASTLTNASGEYSFEAPNGTFASRVTPQSGEPDLPTTITLVVNGADVERDVALYPPGTTVDGLVADALSGEPIRGATVTISGTTAGGVPWSGRYLANSLGRVSIVVYAGQYSVNASAVGYTPATAPVTTSGGGSVPLLLTLTASPGSFLAPPASPPWTSLDWTYVAVVVGIGAAAVAGIYLGTRLGREEYGDDDGDDDGDEIEDEGTAEIDVPETEEDPL
ncbi:MAG: carboxypeptidase regulatory-like domain-containing protein [Thermoplasmata archaeon]|nr:carboxypeptidase regulatory-like domain-containing protein [Thermoplasmata archaeon]